MSGAKRSQGEPGGSLPFPLLERPLKHRNWTCQHCDARNWKGREGYYCTCAECGNMTMVHGRLAENMELSASSAESGGGK